MCCKRRSYLYWKRRIQNHTFTYLFIVYKILNKAERGFANPMFYEHVFLNPKWLFDIVNSNTEILSLGLCISNFCCLVIATPSILNIVVENIVHFEKIY